MKYLCLLVLQTGIAHVRFDLFPNEQRQKPHANFLFILGFKNKAKEGYDLRTYLFKKTWSYRKKPKRGVT